jgi:chromosome segregation protein
MYLKSINIHGFKSFADKTTIDFLPPRAGSHSVTAIVGPNGSGKSNVSDAIRWVMGEQRVSQLRGKKSEDVIFAGSATKGKMGMAMVELIMDNSDGTAPIEYDELIVGRKLYRSGESEYSINGRPVRLLDVQLLLAKAQFAQGSYTVVSQGVIAELLLQTPAERKSFFDEAVGIKEFQIKRHQASLKLQRTQANIEQAELLLKEIIPHLSSLHKQVQKLEERQELELALRELSERYFATLFTEQQTHITLLRTQIAAIKQQITEGDVALHTIQETLAGLAREGSRQEQFMALQRELDDVQREQHELERTIAVLDGRMQAALSSAGKHDLSWLKGKVSELDQKVSELTRTKETAETAYETLKERVASMHATVEQLRAERARLETRKQTLEHESMRESAKEEMYQIIGIKAVQAVLEQRHRFSGTVHGAVAQLASVGSEYALALEVAAGAHLSSLVVDTDTTAQAAVQFLRDHRLGYATFLPLSTIQPRPIPHDVEQYLNRSGVVGLAVDLISCEETFDDIFLFIFGSTMIVESIDVARSIGIGRYRMVTLDGDVLERGGSIKGGYRTRRSDGIGFGTSLAVSTPDTADREKELVGIADTLASLRSEIDRHEMDMRLLDAELQTAHGALVLARERHADAAREHASTLQELQLIDINPEEYDTVMQSVAADKANKDARLVALQASTSDIQEKIAAFNTDEESKKQRIFALQDDMTTAQQALNTYHEQKNILDIELARYETKQEDLLKEVYETLHVSIESIISREPEPLLFEELDKAYKDMQAYTYKLSLIGGIDPAVVDEYAATKERHDGLSLQLSDLTRAVQDLETLIDELDEMMRKKRNKGFRDIRKEFRRYFEILFEGGTADLIEVYGDESESNVEGEEGDEGLPELKPNKGKQVLTGIDITANPPGKKIKHIQVLSGGERTMTSIALICAILRTNPSPFVVLDEVEAALDEANSVRFTNILKELASESQFILITHNRATMHVADALYGVTMGNDGMSRLLSVRLEQAEEVLTQ